MVTDTQMMDDIISKHPEYKDYVAKSRQSGITDTRMLDDIISKHPDYKTFVDKQRSTQTTEKPAPEKTTGQMIASKVAPYARPVLEYGGMALGAAAGTVAEPGAGTVLGAGLMYAGGRQAANALEEYSGDRKPTSLGQATSQAISDVPSGMVQEITGQGAGKVLGKAAEYGGKWAKNILGTTTGVGGSAMPEKILEGSPAAMNVARGKIPGEEVVNKFKDAVHGVREDMGNAYRKDLVKLKGSTEQLDTKPIEEKTNKLIADFVRVDKNGNPDWSRSALGPEDSEGVQKIKQIVDIIKGWGRKEIPAGKPSGMVDEFGRAYPGTPATTVPQPEDKTIMGLDMLKRQLKNFYSDNSDARRFVTSLYNTVKQTIVDKSPQYAEMTKNYEKVSDLLENVQKGLLAGDKNTATQTLQRLTSSLKENQEIRYNLLNAISDKSGEDLTALAAGYSAKNLMPHGLFGKVAAGSEVFFMKNINPVYWPLLATSSPRAVAEFLNVYGKALRMMPGTATAVGRTAGMAGLRQSPEEAQKQGNLVGTAQAAESEQPQGQTPQQPNQPPQQTQPQAPPSALVGSGMAKNAAMALKLQKERNEQALKGNFE